MISQHIKPNMPLTPQVIASVNLLHQQQVQGASNINTGKVMMGKTLLCAPKAKLKFKVNSSMDGGAIELRNCSKYTLPVDDGVQVTTSDVPPSTLMTVQPPLTINFNDLNGYFTTIIICAQSDNVCTK